MDGEKPKAEPVYDLIRPEDFAELNTPEESMRLTQGIRGMMLSAITKGGKTSPKDPDEAKLAVKILSDMDKQTNNRMRDKNNKEAIDVTKQALEIADQLFHNRDKHIAQIKAGMSPSKALSVELPGGFVPVPGQGDPWSPGRSPSSLPKVDSRL